MKEYFNPKSLTFWVGVLLIAKVVAKGFGVDLPIPDEALGGAGLIGLRKAIAQMLEAGVVKP